jgi:hypothetical protein
MTIKRKIDNTNSLGNRKRDQLAMRTCGSCSLEVGNPINEF